MNEFDKELENIVTLTGLTTVGKIDAIKQAIEKHVIGEDEITYGNYDEWESMKPKSPRQARDKLRTEQRQKLHQK